MAWERAVILISTQVLTREIRELVRVRAVSHWTVLREQAGQVRPRQLLCGNATLDSCRR